MIFSFLIELSPYICDNIYIKIFNQENFYGI